MACLGGSHREVKAECRQRKNLRHVPLLGSMSKVLWGSQARTGFVNSNQKIRGLVSSTGVYKVYMQHWEAREIVFHKDCCIVASGTYICW